MTFDNIDQFDNIADNTPLVFVGKRIFETLSNICVEMKPCNASLSFVWKGMFVSTL